VLLFSFLEVVFGLSLNTPFVSSFITVATDGLPSDQFGISTPESQSEFIESLKQLQLLPVWIIIRLCTHDRAVLNFYRRLDKELEKPVDVLGGFLNESMEIGRLNKWLNYSMALHHAREMGIHSRLSDLLDERQLTKDEFKEFVELMYGKEALESAPDIHANWEQFITFVEKEVLPMADEHWSPNSHKMESLIDIKRLKTAYSGGMWGLKDKVILKAQKHFSRDVI